MSEVVSQAQGNAAGETRAAMGRHDRAQLMTFVADAHTETALRDGLADLLVESADMRRGGIRAAIGTLQKVTTPRILVVDVSGEDEPLAQLGTLAEVVEPDVCVLVIGDIHDITFYREVTRGLGAMEYLAKPLTRDIVARHFGPFVRGQAPTAGIVLGGRLITITGAQGGAGASLLAANLAWHLGVERNRHTVLLDADLHRGTGAFLLNIQPSAGLQSALETPERIDALLAERAAQPVAERLHVLASEVSLGTPPAYADGAATALLAALRKRYNFIVADVPFNGSQFTRDLLLQAHQRVIVMEPTLVSIRDALKLLGIKGTNQQSERAVIALNRMGIAGGLQRRQVEDTLGLKVDLVIPDLPRVVANATNLGEPAAAARSPLRNAILELTGLVAQGGMLDASKKADAADGAAAAPKGWKLFGWRK
jgi:pilus assembly protein CpaE